VAAKLESRRILERTARGRGRRKGEGVKFGRKPTLNHDTERRRPASALPPARRNAASPAPTRPMQVTWSGSKERL